jgi:hypothetical protein
MEPRDRLAEIEYTLEAMRWVSAIYNRLEYVTCVQLLIPYYILRYWHRRNQGYEHLIPSLNKQIYISVCVLNTRALYYGTVVFVDILASCDNHNSEVEMKF